MDQSISHGLELALRIKDKAKRLELINEACKKVTDILPLSDNKHSIILNDKDIIKNLIFASPFNFRTVHLHIE